MNVKRALTGYTLPIVLILVIVDILFVTFVKDCKTNQMVSLAFVNVGFLTVALSAFARPKSVNSNIFSLTNIMISGAYLVIESIFAAVVIILSGFTDEDNFMNGVIPIVIQVVLYIAFLAVFIMNLTINKDSAAHDENVRKSHRKLVNVQETVYTAFKNVSDPKLARVVEDAYDKARSISGYGRSGMEEYDEKLADLAKDILECAMNGEDEDLQQYCKRFCMVCDERNTAVKSDQRRV